MRGDFFGAFASMLSSTSASAGVTSLHKYAFHGLVEKVRECLDNGDDPNVIDADGETPLSAAAINGKLAVMELLISRGANVNHIVKPVRASTTFVSLGRPEVSILTFALNRCQFEAAKLLINSGAIFGLESFVLRVEYCHYYLGKYSEETISNPDLAAYINAIKELTTEYFTSKVYRDFYSNLKAIDETLGTKLPETLPLRVTIKGLLNWEISRQGMAYIKVGLALNNVKNGKNGILTLLQITEKEIAEHWLSADDIIHRICRLFKIYEAEARVGMTGLDELEHCLIEFIPIRERMKAHGLIKASLMKRLEDVLRRYQRSTEADLPDLPKALRRAAGEGNLKDVEQLLDCGSGFIDSQDTATHHRTALHWAAINGHAKIARLLLDKGADPALKDRAGCLAEDYALKANHGELKSIFEYYRTRSTADAAGLTEVPVDGGAGSETPGMSGAGQ